MARKHSMGMLLADRLKGALVDAVAAHPGVGDSEDVLEGLRVLREWDNTVAADARGGVLFEAWYLAYVDAVGEDSVFAEPWNAERPLDTPRGLADPEAAVAAFVIAVEEVLEARGRLDVPWGEVHRVLPRLLELSTDVPLVASDPLRVGVSEEVRELRQLYRASLLALEGRQEEAVVMVVEVLNRDPNNPYYRWIALGGR